MKYEIRFSEDFSRQLDEMLGCIIKPLYGLGYAKRLYDGIEKIAGHLENDPYIYPLSRIDRLAEKGVRYTYTGKYVIFYSVDEETHTVVMLNFFYGKSNIEAYYK